MISRPLSLLSQPVVSVCVMSYNHDRFIDHCLSSIVAQDTSFAFEIIVGDDASSDDSAAIIREHALARPDLFRTVFRPQNVGPYRNYREILGLAKGRYVAYLDGDDAMLPGKLEAQVGLLEGRPDLSAAFHQVALIDAEGRPTGSGFPLSAPAVVDAAFLVRRHPVFAHSSMMYRRGGLGELLSASSEFVDFQAYIELATRGSLGYLAEPLGQYREGVGISRDNFKWIGHVQAALDYAERAGVDPVAVRAGRSNQYYLMAGTALWGRRFDVFRELVEANAIVGLTTPLQRVFHLFRRTPRFLLVLHKLYVAMRRLGLVSDWKRNH